MSGAKKNRGFPLAKSYRARVMLFSLVFITNGHGWVRAGEIDRLLAAVNGKIITEGDLQMARSLNAIILFGRSVSRSKEAEVNRLIDIELIRQELANFSMAEEDDSKIEARIQDFRNAYAEIGGLPALLARLGLQESELISYLRFEASILKFVDFRFRPFVSVSEDEIKAYYKDKLISQLQKVGAQVPPLDEVSSKIEGILREEKVSVALEQWILNVRHHARLEYFFDDAPREWSTPQ